MNEFICVSCKSSAVLFEENSFFPGTMKCKCLECEQSWIQCDVCAKIVGRHRKRFVFDENDDEFRKHYRRYHFPVQSIVPNKYQKLTHIGDGSIEENVGISHENFPEASGCFLPNTCHDMLIDDIDVNNINSHMNDYFAHKFTNKCNHYLVSLSQFNSGYNLNRIRDEDVEVHMDYAHLLMKTNRTDRSQLVSTIDKIVNLRVKQEMEVFMLGKGYSEASEDHVRTKIPLDVSSARSLYLKGKYSILERLPQPKVSILEDGKHAYVSLFEIIQDAFGHGIQMLNLNDRLKPLISEASDVTCIYESKRAQEIRRCAPQDAFVFLIVEWRDDAKANRGMRNNGCLWIKTVSFVSGNNHELRKNTYPIAIGPKGVDHEIVESKFKKELLELKNQNRKHFVFSSVENSNIRVYGDMFASLMDQPERRSSNAIMLGNGTFSSRWGYSLNLNALQNVLPSCSSCYKKNLRNVMECPTSTEWKCNNCLNWNIDKEHKLIVYPSPNSFPDGELNQDKFKKLKPFKLNYDIIIQNVSKVFDKIKNGKWSVSQARSFLSVLCISHSDQDSIIAHAKNAYELEFLEKHKDDHPIRYINIQKQEEQSPSLFIEWKLPSLWTRQIPFKRTRDVVMHLIFLGIEKSVNKDITKFMLYNEKFSSFSRHVKDLFSTMTSLSIKDWCDILPYEEGNFSNWISDNHLAMSRLSSWFYASLQKVLINHRDPNKPVSSWSKSDCLRWLKYRGLSHDDRSVQLLREKIVLYKSQSNVPRLLERHDMEKQCDLLMSLVNCKTCLIYRIMSKNMNKKIIQEISLYIKLFLSLYVKFDVLYDPSKKKPSWVAASNFICLLNLPEFIEEVGPLRNLWEGGDIGEKALGLVKDEFNGFRKHWTKALLTKLYNQSTMRKIKESMNSSMNENNDYKYNRYGRFHKYSSRLEVRLLLQDHKVLSIIEYDFNVFLILFQDGSSMRLHLQSSEDIKKLCGFTYFVWTINNTESKDMIDAKKITRYCLLLPWLVQNSNDRKKYYTVISDDWKTLSQQKNFVLPNMSDNDF